MWRDGQKLHDPRKKPTGQALYWKNETKKGVFQMQKLQKKMKSS